MQQHTKRSSRRGTPGARAELVALAGALGAVSGCAPLLPAPDAPRDAPAAQAEPDAPGRGRARLERVRRELELRLAALGAGPVATEPGSAARSPDEPLALAVAIREVDGRLRACARARELELPGLATACEPGAADVEAELAAARARIARSRARAEDEEADVPRGGEAARGPAYAPVPTTAAPIDERRAAELEQREIEALSAALARAAEERRARAYEREAAREPPRPSAVEGWNGAPDPATRWRCAPGDPLCADLDGGAPGGVAAAAVVGGADAASGLTPAVEQTLPRLHGCLPATWLDAGGVALSVRARLGADGALHEVRLGGDAELPPAIEACLVDALGAVRAGPRESSLVVTFPLWLR
ncbi:MAG: hypothetical protein IT373_23855 [Polyangiaceae bacterium]|nr:hypothetical protein [Polyangiaceae bacterium]